LESVLGRVSEQRTGSRQCAGYSALKRNRAAALQDCNQGKARVAQGVTKAARVSIVHEEEPMTMRTAVLVALGALVSVCFAAPHSAPAQSVEPEVQSGSGQENPALTAAQRRAIYTAVSHDKSKMAKTPFAAAVGASVPPMIELYPLPDQVLAQNRAANFYEYTLVRDKVVLVDPTKMRVVEVIGPP
jgi:hypothetical protein